MKKVDEEEYDVAKGAVIPEKYNNAMWAFSALRYMYLVTDRLVMESDQTRAAADENLWCPESSNTNLATNSCTHWSNLHRSV